MSIVEMENRGVKQIGNLTGNSCLEPNENRGVRRTNGEPPDCNTGAGTTNGLSISIDYYRCKFEGLEIEDVLEGVLGIETSQWDMRDWGHYRYRRSAEHGKITVYGDGSQANMGTLVQVSGDGCRLLEGQALFDWDVFLRENRVLGGRETRLDLALDYKGPESEAPFSPYVLAEVRRRRAYTSVLRSGSVVESEEDGRRSCTVYFGSRKSGSVLRFYDKGAEQRADLPEGWVWYRCELEAGGPAAQFLVNRHLDDALEWSEILYSWLAASFTVRVPDVTTAEHRERWPVADWWLAFLGTVRGGVRYVKRAPAPSIERVIGWLLQAVGPSWALMAEYLGPDRFAALSRSMIQDGQRRWRQRHSLMLSGAI